MGEPQFLESGPRGDDNTQCAFFYGTLMVPEVFYSVCYNSKDVPPAIAKLHSFHAAILHDYCRHRVQHADYPGITEEPNHEVFGTFTTGLTEANLCKLDFFEGDQYERRKVQVRLLTKVGDAKGVGNVEGEGRTAEVYVFLNKNELEQREWDLEEFRRDKLQKWTRAGYVFEDCDPERPAAVAEEANPAL